MSVVIFSELYSIYYNTVAAVLTAAMDHPVGEAEMIDIIRENAFGESVLQILPALKEQRWQLLFPDGTTPLVHTPSMPLTTLEKRWLKSVSLDPRIRLFTDEFPAFPEVEPLFTPDDFDVFDKYADGDPYEDATYISHFRLVLDALRNQYPLEIEQRNRGGRILRRTVLPDCLEYSEKDDKFRLVGKGRKAKAVINMARITGCRRYDRPFETAPEISGTPIRSEVIFELKDKRNALERVLMNFAHFEKEAEKLDNEHYRVRIVYDRADENEIVIRILSFGPMLRVISPDRFITLIKQRLLDQKSCGL